MTALSPLGGMSRLSAALREAPEGDEMLEDWLSEVPGEDGPRCDVADCGVLLTRAEGLNGRCERHRRAYLRAAGVMACEACEGSGWETYEDANGASMARRCRHLEWDSQETVEITRERRLQHLDPDRIDPAQAERYWSSPRAAGEAWCEEFLELLEHYEAEGNERARAVQLAAADVHRLKSSRRIGRRLPSPSSPDGPATVGGGGRGRGGSHDGSA